jgi:hypothetical protein
MRTPCDYPKVRSTRNVRAALHGRERISRTQEEVINGSLTFREHPSCLPAEHNRFPNGNVGFDCWRKQAVAVEELFSENSNNEIRL